MPNGDSVSRSLHSTGVTTNALCFDIDDLAHSAMQYHGARVTDPEFCVEQECEELLEFLDDLNLTSTMFVPGYVAERFPRLVRTISDAGHELASHGYRHVAVESLQPQEFFEEVSSIKRMLEDLAAKTVDCYKAPVWSITPRTHWAYDELARAGYRFDNSALPALLRSLGYRPPHNAPILFHGIVIIPVTSVSVLGFPYPMNGGGFTAFVPLWLQVWYLRRVNQGGLPFNYYCHPFEVCPGPKNRKLLKYGSLLVSFYSVHNGVYKSFISRLSRVFQFAPLMAAYQEFLPSPHDQ